MPPLLGVRPFGPGRAKPAAGCRPWRAARRPRLTARRSLFGASRWRLEPHVAAKASESVDLYAHARRTRTLQYVPWHSQPSKIGSTDSLGIARTLGWQSLRRASGSPPSWRSRFPPSIGRRGCGWRTSASAIRTPGGSPPDRSRICSSCGASRFEHLPEAARHRHGLTSPDSGPIRTVRSAPAFRRST